MNWGLSRLFQLSPLRRAGVTARLKLLPLLYVGSGELKLVFVYSRHFPMEPSTQTPPLFLSCLTDPKTL